MPQNESGATAKTETLNKELELLWQKKDTWNEMTGILIKRSLMKRTRTQHKFPVAIQDTKSKSFQKARFIMLP